MGYAAATGRVDGAAMALYVAAIVWILGYDTIYAHQDREDDALVGVRSTARLFARQTKPFLIICYMATIGLLALAGGLAGLAPWFYAGLIPPAALLAWQIIRININDPGLCLGLFKLNRETGAAIGLAILLGHL